MEMPLVNLLFQEHLSIVCKLIYQLLIVLKLFLEIQYFKGALRNLCELLLGINHFMPWFPKTAILQLNNTKPNFYLCMLLSNLIGCLGCLRGPNIVGYLCNDGHYLTITTVMAYLSHNLSMVILLLFSDLSLISCIFDLMSEL